MHYSRIAGSPSAHRLGPLVLEDQYLMLQQLSKTVYAVLQKRWSDANLDMSDGLCLSG